jgi:hypothetical protein
MVTTPEYESWWDSDAGKPASLCDACGQKQRLTQQTSPALPDGGWIMEFEHFGYYGGFSDDIEVAFGKRDSNSWSLCHDCVVKFFETFPALAEQFAGGHHPNFIHTDHHGGDIGTDHPSCCRFAWTWNVTVENGEKVYETFYGDGTGGWVAQSKERV